MTHICVSKLIIIGSDNGLSHGRRQAIIWSNAGIYSETTWAVGIAQLTHHEVQGGGKNPETEGRGIFAPNADRVVS